MYGTQGSEEKDQGLHLQKSMSMPRTRQSGKQQESSVKTECGSSRFSQKTN